MMGPFALMDLIGLDVILAVEELWYKETDDPRDKPQKILAEKVKNKELGVKTGQRFLHLLQEIGASGELRSRDLRLT